MLSPILLSPFLSRAQAIFVRTVTSYAPIVAKVDNGFKNGYALLVIDHPAFKGDPIEGPHVHFFVGPWTVTGGQARARGEFGFGARYGCGECGGEGGGGGGGGGGSGGCDCGGGRGGLGGDFCRARAADFFLRVGRRREEVR
eukprot:6184784-Pleurochrysis_carterae.AAC.1